VSVAVWIDSSSSAITVYCLLAPLNQHDKVRLSDMKADIARSCRWRRARAPANPMGGGW